MFDGTIQILNDNDYSIQNTIQKEIQNSILELVDHKCYSITTKDYLRYFEKGNSFHVVIKEFKNVEKTFFRYYCFAFNNIDLVYKTTNAPYSQDFPYSFIMESFIKGYKELISKIYNTLNYNDKEIGI